MSMVLNLGTKPEGLSIKTHGIDSLPAVYLGDYEISMKDFFIAAEYVLTNTDLVPNDPRLQFVKRTQSMQEVDGYSASAKRFMVPPTKS